MDGSANQLDLEASSRWIVSHDGGPVAGLRGPAGETEKLEKKKRGLGLMLEQYVSNDAKFDFACDITWSRRQMVNMLEASWPHSSHRTAC